MADNEEKESDDEHTYSNYYYSYNSRLASHLNADEREQIFGLAPVQPGNPVFMVVLQKSHVRRASNFLVSSILLPCNFSLNGLELFLPTNLGST